ncbi:TPA: DUF4435 domain-containing protein [Yersinia enterocolitica]|nr:DUF4435 domain-containing protein [Yersinia enterocolitica]
MSGFDSLLKSAKYLKAYTKQQTGKSQGVLYVENPSDRLFWESIIAQVCPEQYSVKSFSLEDAPGKRSLEKEYSKLHRFYIVGVDGDFDYLCPDRHEFANSLNSNPYVIHTFTYSRENVIFSIPSILDISNRLAFRHKLPNDCIVALTEYSKIIFSALSVFSYAHNLDWQKFKEDQFTQAISLPEGEKLLTDDLKENSVVLDGVRATSQKYINSILNTIGNEIDEKYCCKILTDRRITPEIAYMFINGHYLKDNIVKPMLDLLKRKNKYEDINEVKAKLPNDRWKQSINEVENYFKNCCHIESIIHNANCYTSGEIWRLIKEKFEVINSAA